jgi:hypothetical protein
MVLRLNHILSYFCLLTLVIAWCLVKHRDIFTFFNFPLFIRTVALIMDSGLEYIYFLIHSVMVISFSALSVSIKSKVYSLQRWKSGSWVRIAFTFDRVIMMMTLTLG